MPSYFKAIHMYARKTDAYSAYFKDSDIEVRKTKLRYHLIYSMTGLYLGLSAMFYGIALILNSISGAANLLPQYLESSALPIGIVIVVLGLFTIVNTRFKADKASTPKG